MFTFSSYSTYKLVGAGTVIVLLITVLSRHPRPAPTKLSTTDVEQLLAELTVVLNGKAASASSVPQSVNRSYFIGFYLVVLFLSAAILAAFALLLNMRRQCLSALRTLAQKHDTAVEGVARELHAEIVDVRDKQTEAVKHQRSEVQKATSGITQLWREVYRLRHECPSRTMIDCASIGVHSGSSSSSTNASSGQLVQQSQNLQQHGVLTPSAKFNLYSNKPFLNSCQNFNYNNGGSSSSGSHGIYRSYKRFPPVSVVPSTPKKANMLKTEFGTFDISTSEGRQRWIESMNKHSKTENKAITNRSDQDSSEKTDSMESESPDIPESANIEFLIPKLENRRPEKPVVSTTEVKINPNSNLTCSSYSSNGKSFSLLGDTNTEIKPSDESFVLENIVDQQPLTLTEMKLKLEEGVVKGYRRVFIPGRGWLALRKLHEEVEIGEKNQTQIINEPLV